MNRLRAFKFLYYFGASLFGENIVPLGKTVEIVGVGFEHIEKQLVIIYVQIQSCSLLYFLKVVSFSETGVYTVEKTHEDDRVGFEF